MKEQFDSYKSGILPDRDTHYLTLLINIQKMQRSRLGVTFSLLAIPRAISTRTISTYYLHACSKKKITLLAAVARLAL